MAENRDYWRRPLTEQELEEEANKLLLEEDEEDHFSGDETDADPDYLEEQEVSESEQSDEEQSEDRPSTSRLATIKGKNGYKWSTQQPETRGRRKQKNIVSFMPGPKGDARNVKTPLEAWCLLFDQEMLDKVVIHTNEEIICKIGLIDNLQSYHRRTDVIEIRALIGLLYLSGVKKSAFANTEQLWSNRYGVSLFRAVMSLKRFKFLTSCLRFDDKETRAERRINDKLAPIRDIWDKFILNCRKFYTPHSYCTIDEQLMGYRGKCPFRIYLASKPDKYGIKIVMMNHARTWYMVNAIPYIGKVQTLNNESVPSYYVRKLSEPIHGTNRNITVDNWFSSVELFNKMLNEHKITMIGTLRKNKRELPLSFLDGRVQGSSKFAFDDNKTLVSFVPKKNRVVLLLSTMHYSEEINTETGKPQIIMDYNSTKGGTDTFDKLCHTYTTSRATRRWPMRFFCGILDHSNINAAVLLNFAHNDVKMNRKTFLNELAFQLIAPLLSVRLQIPTLNRTLKTYIRDILEVPETTPQPRVLEKRVRCAFCPRERDRKTKILREKCNLAICDDHRATVCYKCIE